MSQTVNSIHRMLFDLRKHCADHGVPDETLYAFKDAYVLWIALLQGYSITSSTRLSAMAERFFDRNHPLEILKVLNESDDMLLSEDYYYTYTDFKHLWLSLDECELLFSLKKMINSRGVEDVQGLHEIFCFMSRLTLDRPELEEDAVASFVETDQRLSHIRDFADLRPVLKRFCRMFDMDDFIPKHGNGVTADSSRWIVSKYLTFDQADQKLSYFIRRHSLDVFPEGFAPRLWGTQLRSSKLICVPKSWKKKRTICAEPSLLQYMQQGLLRAFDCMFCRDPYLRRRINLHDSDRNRNLAWLGSLNGELDTIDLSAASDSVHLDAIWSFPSTVREALICTRCDSCTLPNKQTIHLRKFASMGSAVTFPVECLIFAAIVEQSIIEAGDDPRKSDYSVYGDDIVVEHIYTERVIRNLELFGFRVNTDKTFHRQLPNVGFYRESCGGEYLNMVDVTPLRLSRRFSGFSRGWSDAERFDGLVDIANRCVNPTTRDRKSVV